MELQGLLQAARLLKKLLASLKFPIKRVTLAGDSMCAILALQRDGVDFKTFFQNRLCEVQEILREVETRVDVLDSVLKIDGKINPVDICTRPLAKPEDLGPKSIWQKGPHFLMLDRSQWPLTVVTQGDGLPPEELKTTKPPSKELVKYVSTVMNIQVASSASRLADLVTNVCTRTLKLQLAYGVIARCLRAGGRQDWEARLRENPTVLELQAAKKLVFHVYSDLSRKLYEKGELKSLNPRKRGGLVYVRGRFSPGSMV